jgi:tetratricopeptide (TPR) repeat protein
VRQSELAKKDTDVRLRSVEGAALSDEALGNKDAALKGFRELGNSDVAAFAALGLYHQGRLALAAGERDSAKELLRKALEKAGKPESADTPPGFVAEASKQLLASIDPNAVPQEKKGLTPEQLKALMEQAAAQKAANPDISKEQLNQILKQATQPSPQPPASGAPASKP